MIGLSEEKIRFHGNQKLEVRDVIQRVLLNQYIDPRSTDMKHRFLIEYLLDRWIMGFMRYLCVVGDPKFF